MKFTVKDVKINFAADICGEGQGELQTHLGEISVEASPTEIISLVRDVISAARKEAREQRADDRDARRSHERVERVRASRWTTSYR